MICSLYWAQGLGFNWEGNQMKRNQKPEELPKESTFSQTHLPLGSVGHETGNGMASSSADWALCPQSADTADRRPPEPSQVHCSWNGAPTSCFRSRVSGGRVMELESRGSFKLISRTEMPYPPISRCNSVSTQHWPKSTRRWAEITLDPWLRCSSIPALTPALEKGEAVKKSLL